jgi:hypothetical protein
MCRYLEAICLYENADPKDKEKIEEMLKEVPKLCRKVAGKSIPIVCFCFLTWILGEVCLSEG